MVGQKKLFAGILAIALVAAMLFFAGCPNNPPAGGTNVTKNTTTSPAFDDTAALASDNAKTLLSAADNLAKITDYEMTFEQEASGLKETITLVNSGGKKLAIVETPYDERRTYFFTNETYVCEKLGEADMLCANASNSTLSDYAAEAQSMFIDPVAARSSEKNEEFLISKGAITFIGNPEQKTINGIACNQVQYSIDYSGLSIADLKSINIPADDPSISLYKDYRFVQCADPKTGVPVSMSLTYASGAQEAMFTRTALNISTTPKASLDVPVALSSKTKTESAFESSDAIGSGLISCVKKTNDTDRDSCYASLAFSSKDGFFCEYVKGTLKHDQCYIAALASEQKSGYCEKTTMLKDECYVELAVRSYNKSICSNIANTTLAQTCLSSVNESAKPIPVAPQCTKDSECKKAGCSGTLCVPANLPDTITTCDYKGVYSCYALSSCGCYSSKCGWDENDDYLACINKYEDEYYKSIIQARINNESSSNTTIENITAPAAASANETGTNSSN